MILPLRPLPLMWAVAAAVTAYGFMRDPPPAPAARPILTGSPFVVDGDTIIVNDVHIRFAYMDAPESAQLCNDAYGNAYSCGVVATNVLQDFIGGRSVECTPRDTDRYGRTVAVCKVENVDLGRYMVERGMAVDYVHFDPDGRYAAAQAEAKAARLGIWQGTFQEPRLWRLEHRP